MKLKCAAIIIITAVLFNIFCMRPEKVPTSSVMQPDSVPESTTSGQSSDGQNGQNDDVAGEPQLLAAYSDNFRAALQSSLPEGWLLFDSTDKTDAEVRNGGLVLDGTEGSKAAARYDTTSMTEPLDFTAEFRFSWLNFDSESAYASLLFHIVSNNEYYELRVYRSANTAKGVALINHQAGKEYVESYASYSSHIAVGEVYSIKVEILGEVVAGYFNGKKLIYSDMANYHDKGAAGLAVFGGKAKFEYCDISPTENITAPLTELVQVSKLSAADSQPLIAASITNSAVYSSIGKGISPAYAVFYFDDEMNVVDSTTKVKFASFDEAIASLGKKIIPAFYVTTEEQAKGLIDKINITWMLDCAVIANNPALVGMVRAECPLIRGILDCSRRDITAEDALAQIRADANINLAKTVILPKSASLAQVTHLQKLYMSVWINSGTATVDFYSAITKGVNGVYTSAYESCAAVISGLDKDAVFRPAFIIGHRGQPYTNQENTLKSAKAAVSGGADYVECDVYLTKDNQVVIMHDSTVDRTTNGSGAISDLTLSQIKALKVNGKSGIATDVVPTLAEYLDYLKDTDVVLMIELKGGTNDIVAAVKSVVEKHKMQDQVVIFSFSLSQIKEVRRVFPEVSVGYLASKGSDVGSVMNIVNPLNASYHPSTEGLEDSQLFEFNVRGIAVAPCSYNTQTDMAAAYAYGWTALNTNHALYSSQFVSFIAAKTTSVASLSASSFYATAYTHTGKKTVSCAPIVISSSTSFTAVGDGTYKMTGSVVAVLKYSVTQNGTRMVFYTRPTTIKIS